MKKSMISIWTKQIRNWCMLLTGAYVLFAVVPSIALAQYGEEAFPYLIQGQEYDNQEATTTDIASDILKSDTQDDVGLLKTLSRFFRVTGTQYDDPVAPATSYIKWLLNMLLGLVSFLSLVMIIFAFYLIFFSKGEEAVSKAKKILIGVAVALAIMGLSWFIASFFFDIYGAVTNV